MITKVGDNSSIVILLPLGQLASIQLAKSVLTIQMDTNTAAELARSLARTIAQAALMEA